MEINNFVTTYSVLTQGKYIPTLTAVLYMYKESQNVNLLKIFLSSRHQLERRNQDLMDQVDQCAQATNMN